jgi:RNA polymerase sigma-70 factor (ECF subfamily)
MDQTTFKALVREHDAYVRRVVLSLVRHPQDADVVVSTVWWNVWRAIDRFDWAVRVEIWIYRIARNAALDCLRAKRKRRRMEVSFDDCYKGSDDGAFSSEAPLPDCLCVTSSEGLVQGAELSHNFDKALEALPGCYQEVLRLRIREECSYDDISQLLNVPIGTVMSRLHRARKLLSNCLKELDYEFSGE